MLIPLTVFALTLAGCVALALAFSRAIRRSYAPVVLSAVVGFITAGALVWLIVPAEWTLSFPQTLAASVDSATYGHPIEHYAESLLVVMLVACVVGSLLFSAIAAFSGRLLKLAR